MYCTKTFLVLLLLHWTKAAFDIGFGDDSDLTSFVSRPDIKAPRFQVTEYDSERITPGYWFVGPYTLVVRAKHPKNYYEPCQTGPHIYDRSGELIWSGACQFLNQNAMDFRVFEFNDTYFLSTILYRSDDDPKGHGVIMDNSYNVVKNLSTPLLIEDFNMHELNLIDDGNTAIHIMYDPKLMDVRELGIEGTEKGWVSDIGFREVNVATGDTMFEWWATHHISLTESKKDPTFLEGPHPWGWNWFHGNSVDKNGDGDYLISSRFTDAIYKVSGRDGSILWRLGGTRSDFEQDFNFSRQHDARFISTDQNGTELISFLDNAGDSITTTSSYSSGLVVQLDAGASPRTARVVKQWVRPDKKISELRGNLQTLSNGHVFGGWSDNCYISEHTADGDLLMEAQFVSERMVTYRAYKFNFTAAPTEPPTAKAFVFGTSSTSYTTVSYVSWNGATEVDAWTFYGKPLGRAKFEALNTVLKTGFETVFQHHGYFTQVYVEALAADGSIIGQSGPIDALPPPEHKQAAQRTTTADQSDKVPSTLQFPSDELMERIEL